MIENNASHVSREMHHFGAVSHILELRAPIDDLRLAANDTNHMHTAYVRDVPPTGSRRSAQRTAPDFALASASYNIVTALSVSFVDRIRADR